MCCLTWLLFSVSALPASRGGSADFEDVSLQPHGLVDGLCGGKGCSSAWASGSPPAALCKLERNRGRRVRLLTWVGEGRSLGGNYKKFKIGINLQGLRREHGGSGGDCVVCVGPCPACHHLTRSSTPLELPQAESFLK